MTVPNPDSGLGILTNGLSGDSGGGSVPVLSNGTPNFGLAGTSASTGGALSTWDLPSGVNPNRTIWFDIGKKKTQTGESVLRGPGGRVEDTNPVTSVTAYRIMKSPAQIMAQFAALSQNNPQEYLALQRALASGPWGKVNPTGAWDASTESALGQALKMYTQLSLGAGVGMSFSDYLIKTGQRAQQLGGKGTSLGDGSSSSSNIIQVTDPAQIREAAQQAAQQALGEGLSEDQLNAFVSQFQAAQGAAQLAGNGSVVSAPDLTAQAMQYVQSSNPAEYQSNQRQAFEDTLVNMFAPSASQRPNMTPVPSASEG